MLKLTNDVNLFMQNTSEKFIDYEEAFIELEKSMLTNDPLLIVEQITEVEDSNINMIIQEGHDDADEAATS